MEQSIVRPARSKKPDEQQNLLYTMVGLRVRCMCYLCSTFDDVEQGCFQKPTTINFRPIGAIFSCESARSCCTDVHFFGFIFVTPLQLAAPAPLYLAHSIYRKVGHTLRAHLKDMFDVPEGVAIRATPRNLS